MATKITTKHVETLTHDEAKRKNLPSAEQQSFVQQDQTAPKQIRYPRNTDLDPQLVWRGKDEQDWSDLVVNAPPLYIQEKVHPKVLIDDLLRHSKEREHQAGQTTADLFADFNGIPKGADKTEFYQHDQNWTNRMILGDSLQVMASLAEREGLRGKVQCIYFDPPYGIKFNSNFQWSTTSRDVKDGKADHITREPEQVKAFRDTWRDGIHSYLTYLRDRLTVARDLLTESGSIFVQIGDENVHRVRAVMDEVFGDTNVVSQIAFRTTTGRGGVGLSESLNYLLWYSKSADSYKYRALNTEKIDGASISAVYSLAKGLDGSVRRLTEDERQSSDGLSDGERIFASDNLTSARPARDNDLRGFSFQGKWFTPNKRTFATDFQGLKRIAQADRIFPSGSTGIRYIRFLEDFPSIPITNMWADTGTGGFNDSKVYVVQTSSKVIQRCILMTTDPSDLVLDPTCGSGTTATVAEQWGRRWITIDTSRVALALARARIMGARYPFYLLADSREGQQKEAEVTRTAPSSQPVQGNIRHGFVYERVPHITLKSIANNAEIDVIWDKWQATLEPLRERLNGALKTNWHEWEIPCDTGATWADAAKKLHADWWQARIARQKKSTRRLQPRLNLSICTTNPIPTIRPCVWLAPFPSSRSARTACWVWTKMMS